MQIQTLTCPGCHAEVPVPVTKQAVKCVFCGADLPRAMSEPNPLATENLKSLANAALEAGNSEEALSYFTRVLEVDVGDHEAWYGKGIAVSGLSTLANFRGPEAASNINKAVELAPEGVRQEFKIQAACDLNGIAVGFYRVAQRHMVEYVTLDNSWGEYVRRSERVLGVLRAAHELDPQNAAVMQNVISVCRDNLEGVAFADEYGAKDFFGNVKRNVYHVSEGHRASLERMLLAFEAKMRVLQPDYVSKPIILAKAGQCFVATASLGSSEHPDCVALRRFRDEVLLGTRWGRSFAEWYYRHGPRYAAVIAKRDWLRWTSRWLLVRPLAVLSRAVVRLSRR